MDKPTFIHLFICSILFPPLFFGGLFGRVALMSTHIQPTYSLPFVIHHTGEQSLIMLSRQLCSLGLAMSMQALLCLQLHLTLNGLGEMLIMCLLKFTNSILGFIIFYYTVRGLCLASLETVGECSRLLLTIQCFMYYGCENVRVQMYSKT